MTLSGDGFSFCFDTQFGNDYVVEFKDSLDQPAWTQLARLSGTGTVMSYRDPSIDAPMGFYRIQLLPPSQDPLVACAASRLSEFIGVPLDRIEVASVEEVVYPDTCLGCPPPGELCLFIPTSGLRIRLRVAGEPFELRTDGTRMVLCEGDSGVRLEDCP